MTPLKATPIWDDPGRGRDIPNLPLINTDDADQEKTEWDGLRMGAYNSFEILVDEWGGGGIEIEAIATLPGK